MVTKCLNPACSAPFRYLHEGRVFRIDPTAPVPAPVQPGLHQLEYFWLCADCAIHLKVVVEDGKVATRPFTVEPLVISLPKARPAGSDLSISTARKKACLR